MAKKAKTGADYLAEVERIDAEIEAERKKRIAAALAPITAEREEKVAQLAALQREVDDLDDVIARLEGKPKRGTTRRGAGGSGRTRMSKAEKTDLAERLVSKLGSNGSGMSRSEIAEALGIEPQQVGTIVKAAGSKVKMTGERRDARYHAK